MNEKEVIIKGGATLWARQTIDSEIFINKPHVWFKIWFYIVNRVSHKDTKRYKRGETFFQQDWICEATGSTKDQVKKCIGWLRDNGMISTRRSTRGTWLKVCKYSHFQRLDNYYYNVKAPDKAREKHVRSTTEAPRYNKNDKNDKNDKKDIINYSEESLKLAKLLYKLINDNNPAWYVNPNFDKWAEDIDKIIRLDGRTAEQVEWMIEWCQKDDFWSQNILSPIKLRKQFNQMVVKAKKSKGGITII